MLGEITTADTVNDGYAEIRLTNRAGSEQLSVHSKANKSSKLVSNGILDDTHNHQYEEERSSNDSLELDDDLGLNLNPGNLD